MKGVIKYIIFYLILYISIAVMAWYVFDVM
jgi:hypothetical protein